MAVTHPVMYKGMYLGEMTLEQANSIISTRESKAIPNLKNTIFNFPNDMVLESLETGESIRSRIRREGIDYTQYYGELRDYQTVGTAFMYLSPRSIIGDGVGLGKTAEIAALINLLKSKGECTRFLMAVENSAFGQTQAELTKFTGLRIVGLHSEAAKLNRQINKIDWNTVDGMIIKHSCLRSNALSKWIALNLTEDGTGCRIFDTFILDESSVVKNEKSKIYEYTMNISALCKRVHFMNATTFETSIIDIYNQTDMMYPSLLPKKWRIQKDFCTFGTSSYWTKVDGKAKMNWRHELTGYKNQQVFKDTLKLVYFGRCKKDVGMDMPHVHKVYEIEPTNEQSLALTKGYRYMEVLNCPSLIPEMNIETSRKTVPKMEKLMQLVENDFKDSQVMIYCFHNEAQKAIQDECIKIGRKPVILNGQTSDTERYEIQNKFNTGVYDVIITNIKKSLNLYGGDVCIFYSVETNCSKSFQIAGRIDRNVDDKVKTYILLLYKGTDEYKFFTTVVKQRAKDSRDLTIDAKTTVDYFIEAMEEMESPTQTS